MDSKRWRKMRTQTKKVSVIIPVYNAEKYIRKTLDSVLAQSYPDREILLVENGCEDQSSEILLEYAGKHDEIKILNCPDRGAGIARNMGLEQAAGEYILFVDADDYLPDTGILEKYVKAADQTEVDVVVSNYARLWEERILPAVKHSAFSVYSPSSEEFRFRGFFGNGTLSYVWGRLYRRSFLTQNQIMFTNLTYAEDKLFNMECYICGARYLFLEDIGYIYRRNKESISWQYHEDATENWLKMAHLLAERLEEKQSLEYENMIWYTVFFAVFFDSKMEYVQRRKSVFSIRKILKRYHRDELGREAFKKLSDRKHALPIQQMAWRAAIRVFSFGMTRRWYMALAVGIRFLIESKIDERFSDTGIKEEQ